MAVRSGEAVTDPADAPAAVELARLAQRRLQDRVLPSALRISAGVMAVWLVLVALPVTLGSGVHPAALAAGVGVGVLLFSATSASWRTTAARVRDQPAGLRRAAATSGRANSSKA